MRASFIKLYSLGLGILIVSVFANYIAADFNLMTWFSFLQGMSTYGFINMLYRVSVFSFLWLFLIYPLVLGIASYTLYKYIFSK